MISELAVKFRGYHLCRGTLWTANNGNNACAYLVAYPRKETSKPIRTHGYHNAEQAAHDSVNYMIKLFVSGLCAVQCPVCMLPLHTQTKQIWFSNCEVKVLVE